MYLGTCGKSANHKKIWSENSKSAMCHICGRSANVTNYLSSQICGIAICEPTAFAYSSLEKMLFSASPPLPAAVGIKAN